MRGDCVGLLVRLQLGLYVGWRREEDRGEEEGEAWTVYAETQSEG